MRCLYCGKQLPLLKKLTGGGEFCSEAHRQKYQEEYNKLALSRLLQTQNSDADSPNRGELVLASRQHPALQTGRPPLRALEAPKGVDSPLAGSWTPGANRAQRALPPPTPAASQPPPLLRNDLPKNELPAAPVSDLPSLRPVSRLQPAEQSRVEQAKPEPLKEEQTRQDSSARLDPFKKPNAKRDAFTFRPIDPFPEEKTAPPTTPPPAVAAPVAPAKPAAPAVAPSPAVITKPPEPVPTEKQAPPEAPFIVEQTRRIEPPPMAAMKPRMDESFTDGKPPKPDGWGRWEPDIQSPPGRLEAPDRLLPLPGPPGTVSDDNPVQAVGAKEEQLQEREEIRKKILENQVKPGDFKQTVPSAPSGPATVLPICPPAAALERVAVAAVAKAPALNPGLFLAQIADGEDLWMGWSITGLTSIRTHLTILSPEGIAKLEAAVSETVSETTKPTKQALKPSAAVTAKPPMTETSRNYRAAEALKSAAQAVLSESAPNVAKVQPEKPSTPRHEVFVDLSVLGIEEDEDAEAEFIAREGESPPGEGKSQGRRRVAPIEAVRILVNGSHPAASPVEPKLAHNFQVLAWTNPALPTLRLASVPLRPKVVFEQTPQNVGPQKQNASTASAWSAKRLKKNEKGTPQPAPGNSGPSKPVETLVSEPAVSKPAEKKSSKGVETPGVVIATAQLAKTDKAEIASTAGVAPPSSSVPDSIPRAFLSKPAVVAKIMAEAGAARVETSKPEAAKPAVPATPAEVAKKPDLAQPDPVENKQAAVEPVPSAPTVREGEKKSGTTSPGRVDLPTTPPFEAPILGAGVSNNAGFWANLPVLPKIALAVGLIAAIGGGIWFSLKAPSRSATAIAQKTRTQAKTGRSLMVNLPGGWSPDWGGEFNRKKNRTISFYRPSINNDDYRMEFEAQVDAKAVGWVYRAMDGKNYYAYKVEFVKTGPEPGVALTHFTMVNGIESQKHYTPLLKPIRPGVGFKVRLDVKGDEFSAYINDELIEVWQDDRLQKGGFGLMTELGEVGQVRKLQVYELMP